MEVPEYAKRATAAENKAAQAYLRLIILIEREYGSQAKIVANWIAGCWHGDEHLVDLTDLRRLDVRLGDDLLACLDAFRWARRPLWMLIPDGDRRTIKALAEWQLD